MKVRAALPLGYEHKWQENVALGKRTVVVSVEFLHRSSVTVHMCICLYVSSLSAEDSFTFGTYEICLEM